MSPACHVTDLQLKLLLTKRIVFFCFFFAVNMFYFRPCVSNERSVVLQASLPLLCCSFVGQRLLKLFTIHNMRDIPGMNKHPARHKLIASFCFVSFCVLSQYNVGSVG